MANTPIETIFPNAAQIDELVDVLKSVTIVGPKGEPGTDGKDGEPGPAGKDGVTPTIGENGNWYLGEEDTGKPSRGEAGQDGNPGAAAGFGTITATATQLASGAQPTIQAEWNGPNTAKNLKLTFGIPAGPEGPAYTLTDEDMQSIVQDVLAALPNAEGVGF